MRAILKLSMARSKSSTPSPYLDNTVAIAPPTCSHRFLRCDCVLTGIVDEIEAAELRRVCLAGFEGASMIATDAAGLLLSTS